MKFFNLVLAAAGLALASTGANATWIYVSGDTVDFSFDDSFLKPELGSYSVNGDTLSFSPVDFIAEQNGSTGLAIANVTTPEIKIMPKSGNALTGLSLFEQGDYFRLEESNGNTAVSFGGQFIVDNAANSITLSQPLNESVSFNDFLAGGGNFLTTTWSAENSVSLNSVDSATAKVQNLLISAVTEEGLNLAFIENNLLSVSATTVPAHVPVPEAIWLFGSAMALLVSPRRKVVK